MLALLLAAHTLRAAASGVVQAAASGVVQASEERGR
jgi:hypothetical protein